jgi:hypothetical protein
MLLDNVARAPVQLSNDSRYPLTPRVEDASM